MPRHADLHMPRFINLRARLRLAFPALARVTDTALLAVLAYIIDGCSTPAMLACDVALVRRMPDHPERGDGEPQAATESTGGQDAHQREIIWPPPPDQARTWSLPASASHATRHHPMSRPHTDPTMRSEGGDSAHAQQAALYGRPPCPIASDSRSFGGGVDG